MCNLYTFRGNIEPRGNPLMTNFEIVGIAPNTQEATLRPKKDLQMTKIQLVGNSNGKLFLSLTDYDNATSNTIGMLFNGKQVAIRKNEKFMSTDTADETEGRTKAYAFDIPMRFIEGPATHTIQFLLGTIKDEQFIEESKSDIYTLTITE